MPTASAPGHEPADEHELVSGGQLAVGAHIWAWASNIGRGASEVNCEERALAVNAAVSGRPTQGLVRQFQFGRGCATVRAVERRQRGEPCAEAINTPAATARPRNRQLRAQRSRGTPGASKVFRWIETRHPEVQARPNKRARNTRVPTRQAPHSHAPLWHALHGPARNWPRSRRTERR